jgi:hypothetical protein
MKYNRTWGKSEFEKIEGWWEEEGGGQNYGACIMLTNQPATRLPGPNRLPRPLRLLFLEIAKEKEEAQEVCPLFQGKVEGDNQTSRNLVCFIVVRQRTV